MWNTGGTVSRRMVNGDCDRNVDRRGRNISSASSDEWANLWAAAGYREREILRFKHEFVRSVGYSYCPCPIDIFVYYLLLVQY